MFCHFECSPNIVGHNELMTDYRSCHFEGGTTEKSVPIVRDFSSFFVEMTIKFDFVFDLYLASCKNLSLARRRTRNLL